MKLSLKTRMLASFLTVTVLCGTVTTVVGVYMIGDGIIAQAQNKVRLDLNSARRVYEGALGDIRDVVRMTAVRFFLVDAFQDDAIHSCGGVLRDIRSGEGLDFLTLTDAEGTVLLRTSGSSSVQDGWCDSLVVHRVLKNKVTVAGTEIMAPGELAAEGPDLAGRARIPFVPTPRAKPTSGTEETSGMAMIAASPVLDASGRLLGVLYGGRLLNRNHSLVDNIKETVYQGETYHGRDVGTATIFQGDLRIATNVMTADDNRAIGTRVSEEVYDRVLVEGRRWVERAFVVNDWYITAYESIHNPEGKVIGILYVGMLERRFADMKRRALFIFVGISAFGVLMATLLCYALSGSIVRPINSLAAAAERLAEGGLNQQVMPDPSSREIETLGVAFNAMARSIKDRDRKLRYRAQEQISRSERLAMIGRLAAGVAHEINNPLGGILLYSHFLLNSCPEESGLRKDVETVVREAERCRWIVQGLLDFSRQSEPRADTLDINGVLEKTLALLENQAAFQNIVVHRDFTTGLRRVEVDASQMQQVFVNIIINAADAMEGRGELRISSRFDPDAQQVEIAFSDNGCGIPAADLPRLFEPFFTTKKVGKGTGLGLSISHGIVQRHGGSISVESEVGKGTTVTVRLPAAGERRLH